MATVFKGKSNSGKKAKYLINWYDVEQERWRTCTGYTDCDLSVAKGQRLELELAAKREGFKSSVREESIRPIDEPFAEFMTHVRSKNRDTLYVDQLERRIRRLLDEIKARRLIDIEAGNVELVLLRMTTGRGFEGKGRLLSVTTRNEYANSLRYFTGWAEKRRKIEHDPLATLARVEEKKQDKVHPRRGLSVEELARWLNATAEQPVNDLLMVRRGPDKGKLTAKVRPVVLERARRLGLDRRMAYLMAIWTGLRRSKLLGLEWRDVVVNATAPYLQLREEVTKSKRADLLPMHAQLVEELLAFRRDGFKPTDRVLKGVPDMDVLKLDLAAAGIDYGNKEIGFADLHALRMSLNTMLASQGVMARSRQAHLRHADPRLTEVTYFDKSLFVLPHAEEFKKVAAIFTTTMDRGAGLAQEIGGSTRLFGSPDGTDPNVEGEGHAGAAG